MYIGVWNLNVLGNKGFFLKWASFENKHCVHLLESQNIVDLELLISQFGDNGISIVAFISYSSLSSFLYQVLLLIIITTEPLIENMAF